MTMNQPLRNPEPLLRLAHPRSVAVYDEYGDAARAVDYLADSNFPVHHLAIVGTDLKSVEIVTGNLTWGKVLFSGFMQSLSWAVMFAVVMYVLNPGSGFFGTLVVAVLAFGLVSMVISAVQYRIRGKDRDYTSTRGIIATSYEILAEGEYANRARELLGGASSGSHSRQQMDLSSMPPPYGQTPAADQPPADQQLPVTAAAAGPVGSAADNEPGGTIIVPGLTTGPGETGESSANPGEQPSGQPVSPEQVAAGPTNPGGANPSTPWSERPYGSLGEPGTGIGTPPGDWPGNTTPDGDQPDNAPSTGDRRAQEQD